VYAAREARGRRGHATYDDGRQFLDARAARAVRSRSSFGRDVEQGRWMSREYERLVQLHEAGVAIPRPIELSDRLILMEYVGNIDMPAPRLRDVRLDAAEARSALRWVLYDVELMLGANVVHADLSAFNVLWWEGRTKIIDFPQAVDPRFNRNAKMLLERDIRNVCDYFARSGAPADANAIARDLWRRWLRAEL
jgi:RIO kinase 1